MKKEINTLIQYSLNNVVKHIKVDFFINENADMIFRFYWFDNPICSDDNFVELMRKINKFLFNPDIFESKWILKKAKVEDLR